MKCNDPRETNHRGSQLRKQFTLPASLIRDWPDGKTARHQRMFEHSDVEVAVCPKLIEGRCIYLLGLLPDYVRQQIANVTQKAVPLYCGTECASARFRARDITSESALVIINIDSLGDVDEAVDHLLAMRQRSPHVAVIMCSEHFARDSFSTRRAAVADASLKIPCTSASVALAIESAIINNVSWLCRD